jgi:ABC-type transport system involved in cytochrome bd biosynthesis fused ATPase/permease subunit
MVVAVVVAAVVAAVVVVAVVAAVVVVVVVMVAVVVMAVFVATAAVVFEGQIRLGSLGPSFLYHRLQHIQLLRRLQPRFRRRRRRRHQPLRPSHRAPH